MKLTSFTLLELVVALAISSIVVGIVYTSYQLVSSNYGKMKTENHEIHQRHLLHSLLVNDFDQSETVIKKGAFDLQFYSPGRLINYSFNDAEIVRNMNEQSDTFNIEVQHLNIHEIDRQLVDEIWLEATFMKKTMHLRFKKVYAANLLMQLKDEY